MRISQWAGLHNRQAELDFVDVDPERDTPLFLDPYAIDIRSDAWSVECSRHLRSFFNALIGAIRRNEMVRARHLASHLREAGETYLGLSKGRPQGRGIGREQADQLIVALAGSRAVQTGLLSDLGEAELFVEGIASDKISDLTTNIIRGPLLSYTVEQAELWGMPLSDGLVMGAVWDPSREDWVQQPRRALLVNGSPTLLVPKFSVRRVLTLNSQEFYNSYMLSFLQQEYLRAGQALVRALKSGEKRVYKVDVREVHPKSKPALAEFALQHPDILEQYKRLAGAKGALLPEDMDKTFDEKAYATDLIADLRAIPGGNAEASAYHTYIIGALTFLLFPELIKPVKEREIDQRRKRIDISYTNAARDGFFHTALASPQMRAIEIPVECKNYTREVANPELDQLTGRFSHVRGFLGILCCRAFDDKARFIARCKDAAVHRSQFVLAFDDADIIEMLENVARGNRAANDDVLRRRYAELID